MSINAPRLRAGVLRQRAELQRQVAAADGAGGETVEWQKVRDLWCHIRPVSGVQRMESMRRASPISHEIFCRFVTDIDTTNRIVFRGQAYRIEAVWTINERDEYLQMVASAQAVSEVTT